MRSKALRRAYSRRHVTVPHGVGAEVDLVLEDRVGRLVGIEVKCTHTLQKRDFRAFETLAELTGQRFVRGVVPYMGTTAVLFGKGLYALPVSQLWA